MFADHHIVVLSQVHNLASAQLLAQFIMLFLHSTLQLSHEETSIENMAGILTQLQKLYEQSQAKRKRAAKHCVVQWGRKIYIYIY